MISFIEAIRIVRVGALWGRVLPTVPEDVHPHVLGVRGGQDFPFSLLDALAGLIITLMYDRRAGGKIQIQFCTDRSPPKCETLG